ncbi:MAG: PQQ-dependent dehydrogenase, methanol/ethanol family [Acidobacteria bacterium]|nr:PQQ-dependent dehydrogenase, methanol/ethanol family [Acidobacteriota bacterium]
MTLTLLRTRTRILSRPVAALAALAAAAGPVVAQPSPGEGVAVFSPVTWERLVDAANEPHNWLMYNGTLDSQRFSRLDQIDTANVGQLELKWAHHIPQLDRAETTPLVVDGVMFITESPSNVLAVDAVTGRPFWRYDHPLPDDLRLCCGRNNRGVAILGETLYMSTLDAHLVAIDGRSGSVVWNREVADYRSGYSKTEAPLIVKDQVVTGIAGGEYGIRGFLDSYDADTGERLWRTDTIPGPDHPDSRSWAGDSWRTGGAPTWITGSYDPVLNLVYWGTGNPGPDWNGAVREGDNLYSDSVLALNGDTGEMAWYFQFTPHDEHDWDAIQVPVLADIELDGDTRKAMLWANRNGFYYTLDRETGEFLLGKPFAKQTWAEGLDGNGRPIRRPNTAPSQEGTLVSPMAGGATNWWSPAFSPRTNLLYVNAFDGEAIFFSRDEDYQEGDNFTGGGTETPLPIEHYHSAIRAIDPTTGDVRWEFPITPRSRAGVLATAGDLVFSASIDGYFYALHARTGAPLWHISLGGPVHAQPMTYAVNGQQYVTMTIGNTLYTFGLGD